MPQPVAVKGDKDLPRQTGIAIVGGGIIGCSAALELAERGHEVTIFEKGIIAGEQSSRNWGWVRQMGRDPAEIELILKAKELWQGLDKRLEADTGYTRSGICYLIKNAKELARREDWMKNHARPAGIKTRLLGREQLVEMYGPVADKWSAGLYTADDGRAEPQWVTPALAEAARRNGATIMTGCAVRNLTMAAGRIDGVVTEHGPVKASAVLLAGGAWTRHLCDLIGVRFAQLTTISSVLRTKPIDGPSVSTQGDDCTFRRRADGGYTITPDFLTMSPLTPAHFRFLPDFFKLAVRNIKSYRTPLNRRFLEEWRNGRKTGPDEVSAFERTRVLDPAPNNRLLDRALVNLKRDFPQFEGLEVAECWAGCIDVMPDEVPVIDAVENRSGLFIASGFSGHGFGIGPGAGRLAADLVLGDRPCVDPSPFRLARFQ